MTHSEGLKRLQKGVKAVYREATKKLTPILELITELKHRSLFAKGCSITCFVITIYLVFIGIVDQDPDWGYFYNRDADVSRDLEKYGEYIRWFPYTEKDGQKIYLAHYKYIVTILIIISSLYSPVVPSVLNTYFRPMRKHPRHFAIDKDTFRDLPLDQFTDFYIESILVEVVQLLCIVSIKVFLDFAFQWRYGAYQMDLLSWFLGRSESVTSPNIFPKWFRSSIVPEMKIIGDNTVHFTCSDHTMVYHDYFFTFIYFWNMILLIFGSASILYLVLMTVPKARRAYHGRPSLQAQKVLRRIVTFRGASATYMLNHISTISNGLLHDTIIMNLKEVGQEVAPIGLENL